MRKLINRIIERYRTMRAQEKQYHAWCNFMAKLNGKCMIIAVDFDGVLNQSPWPSVGLRVPNAKGAMRQLHDAGHYIIIWTCRTGEDLTRAINWLLEEGIPFDRVNENCPESMECYGNNTRKVHADLYIDDRQVGGFPGWDAVLDWVANCK